MVIVALVFSVIIVFFAEAHFTRHLTAVGGVTLGFLLGLTGLLVAVLVCRLGDLRISMFELLTSH